MIGLLVWKKYPFLPEGYEKWIGCPLNVIPDYAGCHPNHAEHHLDELINALRGLGITLEVVRSSELYRTEEVLGYVRMAMTQRHKIAEIIAEVTGGILKKDWWPYALECPSCHSVTHTAIKSWGGRDELEVQCSRCNLESIVNIRHGSGKLLWRIDWPMRWKALEVTIEPFGEDHNSKGGSYQTGAKIAQEIFGIEPPGGAPYAWLQLKGGAAMHSSGGKAFPVSEAVRGFPPSILWWMVARHPPRDPIQFDPSESYLKEASLLRRVFLTDDTRLKETLAAVESACPVPTALKVFSAEHLAMAAQLGNFNPIETLSVLGRSVRTDEPVPELSVQELASIKYWVSGAGSEYRIQVRSSNDPRPVLASAIQSAIHDLCSRLQSIPWTAKSIHNEVHETARSLKIEPIDLFTALYLLTISKRKGPKIGWFLEALGREKTILLLS